MKENASQFSSSGIGVSRGPAHIAERAAPDGFSMTLIQLSVECPSATCLRLSSLSNLKHFKSLKS